MKLFSKSSFDKSGSPSLNWWDDLTANLKLRLSDVFFSYFLTFEVIFNWKFLLSVFSKDAQLSENKIVLASKFLVFPDSFIYIYKALGEPSPFILSVFCAFFMCVFYPVIASVILFLRKIIIHLSNSLLSSGFPTNSEFNSLKNELSTQSKQVSHMRDNHVSHVGLLSKYLVDKELTMHPGKIAYQFGLTLDGSSFVEDEVVQANSINSALIEKLDHKNIQKDRLYIVLFRISSDLYIVYKLSTEIQISKKMSDHGKSKFVVTKFGKPLYMDSITQDLSDSMLISSIVSQKDSLERLSYHI